MWQYLYSRLLFKLSSGSVGLEGSRKTAPKTVPLVLDALEGPFTGWSSERGKGVRIEFRASVQHGDKWFPVFVDLDWGFSKFPIQLGSHLTVADRKNLVDYKRMCVINKFKCLFYLPNCCKCSQLAISKVEDCGEYSFLFRFWLVVFKHFIKVQTEFTFVWFFPWSSP